MEKTFKQKVCEIAIQNAVLFDKNFVQYEYCICSSGFDNKYHIIRALGGNYLHLVGVNTALSADAFFRKCLNGTLLESDFDFMKKGVGSNALKGAVRDKVKVLPDMVNMFDGKSIKVQPDFYKNSIVCAFATSDTACTLGFSESGHPMSLLKGYKLSADKECEIDLILRREKGSNKSFEEIVFGDMENIGAYKDKLNDILYF